MNDTINQVGAGAPAAYKIVPVEPTREMIDAALRYESDAIDPRAIVIEDYRAMVAAAPSLPECGCCGRTDERDADCDARLAAPAAPVRMCTTMGRPVSECGCPDCGSSLIDWTAAPAVQNAGIQAALDYSRNFANSKPGIGRTEKEHILGLVSLLERVAAPAAPVVHGTTSDKYRAELYDEVWQRARDMGYGNVTDALVELERLKAAAPVVQAEQPPVAWMCIAKKDGIPEHRSLSFDEKDANEWFDHMIGRGCAVMMTPLFSAPTAHPDAALVEALEKIIRQYPNPDVSHVDFRVHACKHAEHALAEYRAAMAGKGGE